MSRALRIEWLKLRRSRVTILASLLMAAFVPILAASFTRVAEGGGTGAIAQKARALLIGTGWDAYMSMAGQISAAAVFVGAGVVVVWVFGREHADRAFPSLFALPVSRRAIATAKLVVLAAWSALLALSVTVATVILGVFIALSPGETSLVRHAAELFGIVALTCLLAMTVAYVASAGRGYLPGIGAVILLLAAAQVSVLFGTGGWFPYAVPGLLAVAGAEATPEVTSVQVLLVLILAGMVGWFTVGWWRRAEVV